tara:strand:- start:4584 stop:4964 length:381 start_codon:yes stop_codon:yes gene_type:complete
MPVVKQTNKKTLPKTTPAKPKPAVATATYKPRRDATAPKKKEATGKPKQLPTPYMAWLHLPGPGGATHYQKLQALHPELTFGELGKKCGAMWKEMPDAKKKTFAPSAERKEAHEKEMANWRKKGAN